MKDEGALSRWSRRKRGVAPEAAEASPEPTAPEPEVSPEVLEANRAAAEAVDLETIGRGSDMSVFERAGVPDWLRRRAFAALWRSDPVFANLDGLNDYDEDFASPSLVMKTFKSAWQAGRGYLKETPEDGAEDEVVETVDASESVRLESDAPAEPEMLVEVEAPEPASERVETAAVSEITEEVDDAPPRVPLRRHVEFG